MALKKYLLNKLKCSQLNSLCLWQIRVKYSDVLLDTPHDNLNSLIYYNEEEKDQVFELVDLLAYITHMPLFLETDNKKLDDTLEYLYENPIYAEDSYPFLRDWLEDDITVSKRVPIPLLLSLYNSALKQPEPLAKCVFLFRVVEYYYENILGKNTRPKFVSDFINEQYRDVQSFVFLPLLAESKCSKYNVIHKWIESTKSIYNKKSKINKKYDLGYEIYHVGRCGSAHAKGGKEVILRQENKVDYELAKEFNIFLELLCRQLIELSYPEIIKFRVLNDPLSD